uniref:Uncharacterized protein n=1 Tax=Nelumbo nucifera TaxID=4432 RepID=A0A822XGP5_NELNU|nr:TPA_asm: hypothetical protein HUJ06_021013 [Nelumbo nucifera]
MKEPNSIGSLGSLELWDLCGNHFSSLWSLSSLGGLDMSQTSICNFTDSIHGLSQLKELVLQDCKRLKSIPELPSSLERIYACGYTEMENFPNLSNLQNLSLLMLMDCHRLAEIEDPERKEPIQEIHMDRCKNSYAFMKNFLNLPQVSLSLSPCIYLTICIYLSTYLKLYMVKMEQGAKDECSGFDAILAGSEVPDWFTC